MPKTLLLSNRPNRDFSCSYFIANRMAVTQYLVSPLIRRAEREFVALDLISSFLVVGFLNDVRAFR